ncbi:MAG TPA: GNVR domain-containing protein [Vicinamibacteria bacterium]|nr:GNVR domain-containing protein [Vicinamibacteria bacterium]
MSAAERTAGGRKPGYLEEPDEEPFDWKRLHHFVYAPLRRPLMVILPWAGIIALSGVALLVLPKKYRSSTLIIIESEKVPDSFVPKVATENHGRSVDTIRPEILSRTRLERVLEETAPFPEIESRTTAVEKMRRAIAVNGSGSDGFTIEFVHHDPHKAQEVTNRLASLFIEETAKAREQQVAGAVDFLVTQVEDARKSLEKKDEAMRRYKEERMGRLPEQLQANLATMSMLQQEMRTVEETLLFAQERQAGLARGLNRPPVAVSSGAPGPAGVDDLTTMRNQLAALRARYTDEHPDVQNLRTRIARLESRMALATSAGKEAAAESPVVFDREQLERATAEVKKLEDRRADLERRITDLRARVEDTPRTEQELANLKRDYDKMNENYTTLLSKQLEAQMAGRLEQRWKGDRFRMLDPASLPEKPYFPKPVILLSLGAILGLFVGLSAALGAEYLDPTVKDSEDLASFLDYPVLARIPHLPGLRHPVA